MLKIFLNRTKTDNLGEVTPLTYEESRELARHEDSDVRKRLARRTDIRPEVLYYLAEDSEPEVRQEVANNVATPMKADLILANDEVDEIRVDLARKIARLLPDIPEDQQGRLREMALEVLEVLAQDQLPRVRQILSEELKHSDSVPHHIVKMLARDVEEIVSVPVLEYSPLLSDQDLLEIIAGGAARGALSAIASRKDVSGDVSEAIVATLDVPAVASLLSNPSAQIREDTLDTIIDNASEMDAWHQPLVFRPDLSIRAVRRIASFVALSLVDTLVQRHNIDEETVRDLNRNMRKRIETEDLAEGDSPADQVKALKEKGELDDEAVINAIEMGQRDFVMQALNVLTGLSLDAVKKLVSSRNPRTVTSLAWKAGLSMRTAIQLQLKIAKVPPPDVLNARNGFDYPLSEAEMKRQLETIAA
jgi:uncharacterized protein (DUF2336 family)